MARVIEIPYKPRPQQKELHARLDAYRFGAAVCHRRFGKTVGAINQLLKRAILADKPRSRFGYVAPTYRQAKAIAWDYLKHYTDPIPGRDKNEVELRVDLPNEARVQLFGADNPDALRGVYFDGVVLDEYGLMDSRVFPEVIRPALADRQGWAFFIGTPNGKNQFYDVCEMAKNTEGWFFSEFKASETGLIPESELLSARSMMTPDEYAQEFECSFEASVKGAIYARELSEARDQGRVGKVPHEQTLKVDTWWDLGVGDNTAIWFVQRFRQEVRLIDYYEASGEGLPHYVKVLQDRRYTYGKHIAPHDIRVRELVSGRSRIEVAKSLGINFDIAPNIDLEDGIHAVRMLLPNCWFDAEKCKAGIEALMNYRRDYNTRIGEFRAVPVHDWSSHGADAFRYGAVSLKEDKQRKEKKVDFPQGQAAWMA